MSSTSFTSYGEVLPTDMARCYTKTGAICHCHELCTFAPLGFSHPSAPFLTMTKLPSMKHSVRSKPPRSFTSLTKARKISSKTPFATHSWKRRCQVWYGGYRLGISCQGAPVRSTHKIPFRIARSSTLGRPLPSVRRCTFGSKGSTIAHCSSLRSVLIKNLIRKSHFFQVLGTRSRLRIRYPK